MLQGARHGFTKCLRSAELSSETLDLPPLVMPLLLLLSIKLTLPPSPLRSDH